MTPAEAVRDLARDLFLWRMAQGPSAAGHIESVATASDDGLVVTFEGGVRATLTVAVERSRPRLRETGEGNG